MSQCACAQRFARRVLELGGNNAAIVAPSADLDLARARRRCSAPSAPRPALHHDCAASSSTNSVRDDLLAAPGEGLRQLRDRQSRSTTTLVGPLIDRTAATGMQRASARRGREGGTVHGGERVELAGACRRLLRPSDDRRNAAAKPIVCEETFAPILYVDALSTPSTKRSRCNNGVSQGLSSSIFTNDVREAERFLSARGQRLRHRQRQHRHQRRRDRRRVRRREGHRRRPRVGLGRLEELHAPRHQHDQLIRRAAAGAGRQVRPRHQSVKLRTRHKIQGE